MRCGAPARSGRAARTPARSPCVCAASPASRPTASRTCSSGSSGQHTHTNGPHTHTSGSHTFSAAKDTGQHTHTRTTQAKPQTPTICLCHTDVHTRTHTHAHTHAYLRKKRFHESSVAAFHTHELIVTPAPKNAMMCITMATRLGRLPRRHDAADADVALLNAFVTVTFASHLTPGEVAL